MRSKSFISFIGPSHRSNVARSSRCENQILVEILFLLVVECKSERVNLFSCTKLARSFSSTKYQAAVCWMCLGANCFFFLDSDEQGVILLMQAGTDQSGLTSGTSLLSVIRLSWTCSCQISWCCTYGWLSLTQICQAFCWASQLFLLMATPSGVWKLSGISHLWIMLHFILGVCQFFKLQLIAVRPFLLSNLGFHFSI